MKDCRSYGADIMGHRVVKVKASTMAVSAESRVPGESTTGTQEQA